MELKTIVKIEKALDINIIDREISPKKKKEVIILSNAFENMESFSHNNDDENFIHKLYASTNANMNRFSDIWHFSNETSSEFMVLPQKERIRKTSKESKIKFLEVV